MDKKDQRQEVEQFLKDHTWYNNDIREDQYDEDLPDLFIEYATSKENILKEELKKKDEELLDIYKDYHNTSKDYLDLQKKYNNLMNDYHLLEQDFKEISSKVESGKTNA